MTRLLTARRTLAAVAVAPLLATGLVACGDGSGGDTASEPTSAAPAASGLSAGDEVDPAEFAQIVNDGLEASTTAHLTMTVTAGGAGEMTTEGDIDYTTDPPEMAMTMDSPLGGDAQMEIRMVDGIFYMSMGQMTQNKFLKIDPADPKGPFADLGMEGMLDQMDPGKALQSMEEGIDKVVFVGEDDHLDQYELTVDMQQMMESMGSELPEAATKDLPDSVTYDLWLDDQGRFARMQMDEMPMGPTTGAMEMTLTDWDADVTIEAPPADQIAKMPDLGRMMQQGMGSGSA